MPPAAARENSQRRCAQTRAASLSLLSLSPAPSIAPPARLTPAARRAHEQRKVSVARATRSFAAQDCQTGPSPRRRGNPKVCRGYRGAHGRRAWRSVMVAPVAEDSRARAHPTVLKVRPRSGRSGARAVRAAHTRRGSCCVKWRLAAQRRHATAHPHQQPNKP
jgi:hypothetical protein